MSVLSPQTLMMAPGEAQPIYVDWGENTAGQETGALKGGDTVASCTVSVDSKPVGAADPTLGSVSLVTSGEYVLRRQVSTGEATKGLVTMASTQAVGWYQLRYVATTTNGNVIPRYVRVKVERPVVTQQH